MSEDNKANKTKNEEGTNLVTTAPILIEGSQINQITQVDKVSNLTVPGVSKMDDTNVDNMTVQGSTPIELNNAEIKNMTVNETHHHHNSSQINQITQVDKVSNVTVPGVSKMDNTNVDNITVHGSASVEINNAEIKNLTMIEETHHHHHNTVQQDARPTFDEEAFTKYLKELKISIGNISGEEILATWEMLHNIPALVESSLENEKMRTMGGKRCTDLYDLFPDGIPIKTLIGILAEPGAGKSVIMKLMQMMFIKSGYFPFLIPVVNMGKEESKFPQFVRDHGYTDFPIKDEDLGSFGEWLTEKALRVVYLFDGLDEASIDLSAKVGAVNIEGYATPQAWMGMLFENTIMKDSMVVLTSRPASVFKLPRKQRPHLVYALDGFESKNMESVVKLYNKDSSDDIVKMINGKASKENTFLRSPLAIALISSTYKKSSDENFAGSSLTAIYKRAFDDRQHSDHNRFGKIDTSVDDRIDEFFMARFKAKQLNAFSAADLKKFDLTVEEVENRSFVKVFCKKNRHLIGDDEKMVEPSHTSVLEYHRARCLLKCKEIGEFNEAVSELFVLDDQDRKTLARRFLSGLIGSSDGSKEKQKVFLKKLVQELKQMMSKDLALKYKGDELTQAMRLQSHLFNDLAELPTEVMEDVKKQFHSDSFMRVRVQLQEESLLHGLTNYLSKVDPHLELLSVTMHDDVQSDGFSKLVDAAVNLSKKVDFMFFSDIRNFDIDVLKKLVGKVNMRLMLRHKDEVDPRKIVELRTTLQNELDRYESIKMRIELEHRCRWELLRHSSYTSPQSPLMVPNRYGGIFHKTVNLSASRNDSISGWFTWFDYFASLNHEIEILSRVLASNNRYHAIIHLRVYFPSGADERLTKELYKNLSQLKIRVEDIRLYNVDENLMEFNDIPIIMQRTIRTLEIYFTYDISTSQKNELESQIESVHKSKTRGLYVLLQFKNCFIDILPRR